MWYDQKGKLSFDKLGQLTLKTVKPFFRNQSTPLVRKNQSVVYPVYASYVKPNSTLVIATKPGPNVGDIVPLYLNIPRPQPIRVLNVIGGVEYLYRRMRTADYSGIDVTQIPLKQSILYNGMDLVVTIKSMSNVPEAFIAWLIGRTF